jgi:hypothetical protein
MARVDVATWRETYLVRVGSSHGDQGQDQNIRCCSRVVGGSVFAFCRTMGERKHPFACGHSHFIYSRYGNVSSNHQRHRQDIQLAGRIARPGPCIAMDQTIVLDVPIRHLGMGPVMGITDLQPYDAGMRKNVGIAGVIAVILFTLSSCAVLPASTGTVPDASAAPCHGAYVADVDTSIPGEPTPEAAATAWAKSVIAPSGAPTHGWKAVNELTVRSGDWIAGVSPTIPGGWVVSGLGCGVSRS